ncbi:hypothetical protein NBRC116600_16510 [Thalassotalea sp. SU-HH00458]
MPSINNYINNQGIKFQALKMHRCFIIISNEAKHGYKNEQFTKTF